MFPFPFSFLSSGVSIPELELIDNDFAMEFNGTDDYISAGDSSILNITNNISISVWFKTSNTGTNKVIINRDPGSGTRIWQLSINSSNQVYVQFRGATTGQATSTTTYTNGEWHNAIAVYDPSTSVKLYIDGALVNTDSTSIPSSLTDDSSVPLYIGAYSNYSSEKFNGDIDEVAIWNKSLALEDVQTIYNSTNNNPGKCANLFTAGLADGLVYWNRMGD